MDDELDPTILGNVKEVLASHKASGIRREMFEPFREGGTLAGFLLLQEMLDPGVDVLTDGRFGVVMDCDELEPSWGLAAAPLVHQGLGLLLA